MPVTLAPSRLLLCSVLVSLSACTYVTNSTWQEKVDCLDEDGDGAVRANSCTLPGIVIDCDDQNPDRSPLLPEIPYDGIDNNCDGIDIVDVDGDLYPEILAADWVSMDGSTTYQPGLQSIVDCNDNDASINPGVQTDPPYDGIDSNCDGADDWDADGDGFVIRADMLTANDVPYTGTLPGGDCDDSNVNVNPGRSLVEDLPYDGVDTNCDGNNDFDADGDGQMPVPTPSRDYASDFDRFVVRFQYQGRFDRNFEDCDDTDPNIYRGAPDVFYDGIDSDCMGDDDYDQDRDGYVLNEDLRPFDSPPYTGLLPSGDCDDTDPNIYIDALEYLGDLVDTDCDGGADTTPIRFQATHRFEGLRPPVVGALDDMYMLITAADSIASSSNQAQLNKGFALRFPWVPPVTGAASAPPMPLAVPLSPLYWEFNSVGPISKQLDAVFRGDRVYIAESMVLPTSIGTLNEHRTRLHIHRLIRNVNNFNFDPLIVGDHYGLDNRPYSGIDLEDNGAGGFITAGCGNDLIHVKMAQQAGADFSQSADHVDEFPSMASNACYVEPIEPPSGPPPSLEAIIHAFGPGQRNYEFFGDRLADIEGEPSEAGFTVNSVVNDDGLITLTGTNPGNATPLGVTVKQDDTIIGEYLQTEEVLWASSAMHNNTLYLVAAVADRDSDGRDDLVILYGNPLSPTIVPLSPVTPSGDAVSVTGVSISAEENRVFIGMTGSILVDDGQGNEVVDEDVIGWAFFAP